MKIRTAIIFVCMSAISTTANSQAWVSTFQETLSGGFNNGWPKGCLALEWPEKPKSVARFDAESTPGFQAYLDLASKGLNPAPVYKRVFHDRWQLDGVTTPELANVRDPWASRIAKVERVGFVLGRGEVRGYAIWRTYAADGSLLGTYDADMVRKTKGYAIGAIHLWSPGKESMARPLNPFCIEPGDHEQYTAAKAAQEAEKARKKAEKEAAKR